jgi:hypothetical protein
LHFAQIHVFFQQSRKFMGFNRFQSGGGEKRGIHLLQRANAIALTDPETGDAP